jgi:hypothetical protein
MIPNATTTEDRHEYWRTCFVAMPYGTRDLDGRTVEFDRIYAEIFKPAIRNVHLGGKMLLPLRSDETVSSGLIIRRMLDDLLLSRLLLADLTAHNFNVSYEMGIRHALVPSGTVVVRMTGVPIPFDVAAVSVTEYQYEPEAAARESRSRISKVLRETLRWNELDSPAYEAARSYLNRMGPPEHPTAFGNVVIAAEEAALHEDVGRAAELYLQAALLEPEAPFLHERRSHLLWLDGHPDEAMAELRTAHALRSPATNVDALLQSLDPSRLLARRFNPLEAMPQRELRIHPDFVQSMRKLSPDQVYAHFLPVQDGAHSEVFVLTHPTVHEVGAVPVILSQYGKVSNQGVVHTPGGHILSQYHLTAPKHQSGAAVAKEAASGLQELGKLGLNLDVKLGGGGFGSSGGGFGSSGGGFTP